MWDAARHTAPCDYGTLSSQCGFACGRAAVGLCLCPLFRQWRDRPWLVCGFNGLSVSVRRWEERMEEIHITRMS